MEAITYFKRQQSMHSATNANYPRTSVANADTLASATQVTLSVGNRDLTLNRLSADSKCFELVFLDDEELDTRQLKELNAAGLIYHSEQTDIEYEEEDGSIQYMNIYYFAQVDLNIFNEFLTL